VVLARSNSNADRKNREGYRMEQVCFLCTYGGFVLLEV
jgi:hypothetical protein